MRTTYRILADLIAVGVVIQAMAMVWAIAGLFHWVDKGGTLNHDVLKGWEDKAPDFQGAVGFEIHGIVGGMVIPVIGLALLVVAFFAKVERGVAIAGAILVMIVIQMVAGMAGDDAPWLGLFHGLIPFAIFSAAIVAARAAHPTSQTAVTVTP
ncbi:MAG: hypothetical protein JF565_01045 [Propionibacteriales bacterium]|nr:hypothetical protein [Propionibacteriales bacterium]